MIKRRRKFTIKKVHNSSVLVLVSCLSLFSSFFLIRQIGSIVNPILYKYFNVEVKRFTNNIVSTAINEGISNSNMDKLFNITKNTNDEIMMLDYNTKVVNQLLKEINGAIENRLTNIEEGDLTNFNIGSSFKGAKFRVNNGIVCEFPMGLLWKNSFLANLGPIIPIKVTYLGYVNTTLKTKLKNYGINNVYLEINAQVEVHGQITMPTSSKASIIKIDAPLTIKLLQGSIPNYYYGDLYEKSSATFSVPIK